MHSRSHLKICVFAAVFAFSASVSAVTTISSIDDFQKIGKDSKYPLDGDYALADDLDAASTREEGFVPVGTYDKPFTGKFDGKGFVIRSLYVDRPDSGHAGLFGYVGATGRVSNLGVVDADVSGSFAVGTLAGTNNGSITLCYSSGAVEGLRQESNAGGLVGVNGGVIEKSYSAASVKGKEQLGGLAGFLNVNKEGRIAESYAMGSVSGSKAAGGLVGYAFGGSISKSFSMGAVSASVKNGAGGLVGAEFRSANPQYNVVGQTGSGASVKPTEIVNCFWDIDASGVSASSGGGSGKTSQEMRQRGTYENAGWDFKSDDGWKIADGGEFYPQIKSPVIPDYTIVYRAGSNGKIGIYGAGGTQTEYRLTLSAALTGPQITAVPNDGYHFVSWSDGDTRASRVDISARDTAFTALFAGNTAPPPALVYYTLSYETNGNGGIRVNDDPASVKAAHAAALVEGVTGPKITAVPNPEYRFSHWSDGKQEPSRIDVADAYKSFVAYFIPQQPGEGPGDQPGGSADTKYTLSYEAIGNGKLIINDAAQTVTAHNATVVFGEPGPKVAPLPNTGYRFLKWSDNYADSARKDIATNNKFIFATFAQITTPPNGPGTDPNDPSGGQGTTPKTYTLHYEAIGNGKLSVDGGTAQTSIEIKNLEEGKPGPLITAVPDQGVSFVTWSDGLTDIVRKDIADRNLNVLARFSSRPNETEVTGILTYEAETGGKVKLAGDELWRQYINVQVPIGTQGPNVTAEPASADYSFTSWNDGKTTATRNDAATSNRTFTARFSRVYKLVYNISNPIVGGETLKIGSLKIDGMEVSAPCTVSVPAGAIVAVEVAIDEELIEGYRFTGWSDGKTENPRSDTPTESSQKDFTAMIEKWDYIPIRTYDDLRKIDAVAGYPRSGKYELMNDIEAAISKNPGQEFKPIGTSGAGRMFTGKFRGNGYAIKNLHINRPSDDYVGLFGFTDWAEIRDVRLESAVITGKYNVGGLVGRADFTTIDNCGVGGTVKGDSTVGGLVGYYQSKGVTDTNALTNSYSTADVGNNTGSRGNFGGLVGYVQNALVKNCHAKGTVAVTGSNVGGVIGAFAVPYTIEQCYSNSAIYVTAGSNVGGLIGLSLGNGTGTITTCYASGTVNVAGSGSNIGGLVGGDADNDRNNNHHITINNSYAIGNVNAPNSDYVGGGVGAFGAGGNTALSKFTIINCYSVGKVVGSNNVGAFFGSISYTGNTVPTVTNCYYDSKTPSQSDDYATDKTTEEMYQASTYVGWDFSNTWAISEGSGYPYLRSLGVTQYPLGKEKVFVSRVQSPTAPRAQIRGKTLLISASAGSQLQVRFYDLRGRVIARYAAVGSAKIPIGRIPSGRYILELREAAGAGKGKGGKRLSLSRVSVR